LCDSRQISKDKRPYRKILDADGSQHSGNNPGLVTGTEDNGGSVRTERIFPAKVRPLSSGIVLSVITRSIDSGLSVKIRQVYTLSYHETGNGLQGKWEIS
jgi:hypothetical protein